MISSIVSIIANIAFAVIMFLKLFKDKVYLPDSELRVIHNSAFERLSSVDLSIFVYLQILISIVCFVTSILVLVGVKGNVLKITQIVSLVVSIIMFAAVMIISMNVHLKY